MRLIFLLTIFTALSACASTAPPAQAPTTVLTFGLVGEGSQDPGATPASIEAIQRRMAMAGFGAATVEQSDVGEIELRIPGSVDIEPIVDLIAPVGALSFNIVDVDADVAEYEVGVEKNGRIALPDDSLGGEILVIFADAIISGSDLSGVSPSRDQSNRPSIAFQLHPRAAQAFGRATSHNVGRPFAIVIDNRIVSAPRIISPIMSGNGQITGAFTPEEAEQMAVILRSGALPVRLKFLSSEIEAE